MLTHCKWTMRILHMLANAFSRDVNATKILYIKKLQAIHLMLYKRWCKTAKIKKYKHELL